MGVVAVVVAWLFGMRLWDYCTLDGDAIVWSVAGTGLSIAFYLVLRSIPWPSLERVDRIVKEFYRNEMLPLPLWKTAIVAAAAGFGEEFLFRGLLQKGLQNWLGGWDGPIIVFVSIVFGLFHYVSKTYVVLAFLISIYLGFLFQATENLVVPTFVHAVYDFFVFVQLRRELQAKA